VIEQQDPTIRVLLVDDQALVRAGFKMLVDSQPDMEVVGEAGDGGAATTLVETAAADVVLMDVRMPRVDGVEATGAITRRGETPRVIVLTTFDLDEYAFAAIKAGASAFLLKDAPPADLLNAIRSVHSGDAVVAPSTTKRLLEHFAAAQPSAPPVTLASLTDRELEVLRLVAQGKSNREIASDLYISENTVKNHVRNILEKLHLHTRMEAVMYAVREKLLDIPGT
jgi:DNA-binding NarL/FixJ family response regulator